MNLTNQSHPFRFLQSVRTLRWASWKPRQRFSIACSGAGAANVGGAVPAATRGVLSSRNGAARSTPPTFLSVAVPRRTMKNLLGDSAKKTQILPVIMLFQALWFLPSDALAQRTLRGRVVNGTTNRPVAQQKVELL